MLEQLTNELETLELKLARPTVVALIMEAYGPINFDAVKRNVLEIAALEKTIQYANSIGLLKTTESFSTLDCYFASELQAEQFDRLAETMFDCEVVNDARGQLSKVVSFKAYYQNAPSAANGHLRKIINLYTIGLNYLEFTSSKILYYNVETYQQMLTQSRQELNLRLKGNSNVLWLVLN